MKQTLLVLSTLLLFANGKAQNRLIKSGTDVNKDDTPYFTSMIGSDNTSFYTLRVDKNIGGLYQGDYSIDQVSKTNANFVKRIATSSKSTRTDSPPNAVMVKDRIFLFTKFNNQSKKTCDFTLDVINTAAAGNAPESRALVSYPTDAKTWYQTYFIPCISPDSTKMGIIANYMNEVTFYLYELPGFKEISNKKITSLIGSMSGAKHFRMDDSGNLFFTRFEGQKFSLSEIPANGGKALACSFIMNKSYDMGDINYTFDAKNQQVYVHSMFYERNPNPKQNMYSNIGIFIAKVDKNTLVAGKEKYHAFSSGILNSIACGKLDKGLTDYCTYNSNLTFTDNSEILFSAEQTSSAQTNRGTNNASMYDMSTRVSFDANEIIVSKLSSNLDLAWMKFIPRRTTYGNITPKTEATIVYTRLYNNGKLKYYFIEHPKFEEEKMDFSAINSCEIPLIKSYPGSNVVEYSLDANGKEEKRVIFSNKKEWLIPVFYDLGLGNDQYIVRFRDDNKEHFGVISLK